MKTLSRIALLTLLLVLLATLVGCSSGGSSSGAQSTPPSTSASGGGTGAAGGSSAASVSIANFAFSPADLTVKVGTKVTWQNNDTAAHTVTADDKSFDSGPINQGASYSFTFAKAGSYSYHCSVHPSMTAKVTVQ